MRIVVVNKIVALLAIVLIGQSLPVLAQTQKLTIRGNNESAGTVLTVDQSATITVQATSDGVVLTLPDIDVRMRCLGEITSDGFCYLAADGISANLADEDNDGVVDQLDQCPNSDPNIYTDRRGCAEPAVTYAVTASAGAGGTISPNGVQQIAEGQRATFTITADAGYTASFGGTCGGAFNEISGSYTTRAVTADCSVTVTFSTASDASYCQNIPAGLEDVVSCSPSRNLDTFWLHEASFPRISGGLDIAPGRILSMPFKTRQSERDKGLFNITTNDPTLDSRDYYFHAWVSSAPGGPAVGGEFCEFFGDKAQTQFAWSQVPAEAAYRLCYLGPSEQVLHMNFEVKCFGPPRNGQCSTPPARAPFNYNFYLTADPT